MANLMVTFQRDVPAQVLFKSGRETAGVQLSHRFQVAVDRASMRAGQAGSDADLLRVIRAHGVDETLAPAAGVASGDADGST